MMNDADLQLLLHPTPQALANLHRGIERLTGKPIPRSPRRRRGGGVLWKWHRPAPAPPAVPRVVAQATPLTIARDNCLAAIGRSWQWTQDAARRLGVEPMRVGRVALYRADELLASLEAEARRVETAARRVETAAGPGPVEPAPRCEARRAASEPEEETLEQMRARLGVRVRPEAMD